MNDSDDTNKMPLLQDEKLIFHSLGRILHKLKCRLNKDHNSLSCRRRHEIIPQHAVPTIYRCFLQTYIFFIFKCVYPLSGTCPFKEIHQKSNGRINRWKPNQSGEDLHARRKRFHFMP